MKDNEFLIWNKTANEFEKAANEFYLFLIMKGEEIAGRILARHYKKTTHVAIKIYPNGAGCKGICGYEVLNDIGEIWVIEGIAKILLDNAKMFKNEYGITVGAIDWSIGCTDWSNWPKYFEAAGYTVIQAM